MLPVCGGVSEDESEICGALGGKKKKKENLVPNVNVVSLSLLYVVMNNHIYSTLFKIQERKSDRSEEIE